MRYSANAPSSVTPSFSAQFPLGLPLRPEQLRASAEEAAMMVPVATALRPRYQTLSTAVAVLAGTDDRIATFTRQSQRFADEIPHASLTAVEGVGHMVHHLVPDRVALP